MAVTEYEAFGFSAPLSWWAKLSGIDRSTLYYRVRHGMTLEEALTADYNREGKGWKRYSDGKEEHTSREWAEILGIEQQTFLKRVNAGLPPEKIFFPGDLRNGQTSTDARSTTNSCQLAAIERLLDKIAVENKESVKTALFAKLRQNEERRQSWQDC